jgi:hypothetical protein
MSSSMVSILGQSVVVIATFADNSELAHPATQTLLSYRIPVIVHAALNKRLTTAALQHPAASSHPGTRILYRKTWTGRHMSKKGSLRTDF